MRWKETSKLRFEHEFNHIHQLKELRVYQKSPKKILRKTVYEYPGENKKLYVKPRNHGFAARVTNYFYDENYNARKTTNRFQYDDNGNLIEKSTYDSDIPETKSIKKKDKNNNVIKI